MKYNLGQHSTKYSSVMFEKIFLFLTSVPNMLSALGMLFGP